MSPGRTRLAWWPWRFPFDRAQRTPNVSTPVGSTRGITPCATDNFVFLPKVERPQNEAQPSEFSVYPIGFLVASSEIEPSPPGSAHTAPRQLPAQAST